MADTAMNAAQFDTYTQGKTLTYAQEGITLFGVEQYRSNRNVTWAIDGGECQRGVWYESKGNICFRYNNDPEPACWQFFNTPRGLRAIYMTDPNTITLTATRITTNPLICPGPEVGS